MDTINSQVLWEEVLNFDELINDFQFNRKLVVEEATCHEQFEND